MYQLDGTSPKYFHFQFFSLTALTIFSICKPPEFYSPPLDTAWMSLPSRLLVLFLPSSSPSAVPLWPATTSLLWVRSPWCQAGLQGRIGGSGGGGGKALYSAGWCGSSLLPPPWRPSWEAAMRDAIEWCLNRCGRQAVGHGRSAIVSGGWQQPPVSCKIPSFLIHKGKFFAHVQFVSVVSWAKQSGAEAWQTRRVSEWSVLTRSTTVCSWIQKGQKWIV